MKLGEFIAQSIENSTMRLDPHNPELTAIRGYWEKLPGGSMARWRRMWYVARWVKADSLSQQFWQDVGRHALRMRALANTQPWING